MANEKIQTVTTDKAQEKSRDLVVAKVVRTTQAAQRHATAKTKKRGEISGGGKKPWKQKGTGRARAGSSRSPIWRGGGIVFGPTGIQNFKVKANRKEKAIALSAAFDKQKSVTKKLDMPAPKKTKDAADFMVKNELTGKVLILLDIKVETDKKQDEKITILKRSFRNIPNATVMFKSEANAYDILTADMIAVCAAKATATKEAK